MSKYNVGLKSLLQHEFYGVLVYKFCKIVGKTDFRYISLYVFAFALRKQAYSNILNILTTKKWKSSDKNSDISHTSGQNIDYGYSLEPPRRGGSNEYPQSMFLGRNKKNNVYPCKPQFYNITVGFKGVNII